jgi:hypothetical protein
MAAWNDLFDASLMEIGVLEAGGTGATADRTYCLGVTNRLLGTWSAELGPIHYETVDSLSWTASQASRTIGSGGNFSVARPERIISATYRDSSDNDSEIEIITHQQYQMITDKATEAETPLVLAYNPTIASSLGTLYIWPVPSATATVRLNSYKPFTTITDQTATVVLPSGYEAALVFNLAVQIAAAFGANLSPATVEEARRTKRVITQANIVIQPPKADPLAPGQRSRYNPWERIRQ